MFNLCRLFLAFTLSIKVTIVGFGSKAYTVILGHEDSIQ